MNSAEVLHYELDYAKHNGEPKTRQERQARLGNVAYLLFSEKTADNLLAKLDARRARRAAERQARTTHVAPAELDLKHEEKFAAKHDAKRGFIALLNDAYTRFGDREAARRANFQSALPIETNDFVLSHRMKGGRHRAKAGKVYAEARQTPVRSGGLRPAQPAHQEFRPITGYENLAQQLDDQDMLEIAAAATRRARLLLLNEKPAATQHPAEHSSNVVHLSDHQPRHHDPRDDDTVVLEKVA